MSYKFRVSFNLLGLTLSMISLTAQALSLSANCNSVHNSWNKEVQNIVTSVSVIYQYDDNGKLKEKDFRVELRNLNGPHINEAFRKRLRINTGYVYCRSADPNNKLTTGTGFLYGNGMQLLTAKHVILDKSGNTMPECWYRTREGESQKVELDVSPSGMHPFTNQDLDLDGTNDMVAIKLKQPVKGANPFPLDGAKSYPRERLLAVAAFQSDAKGKFDPTELIAHFCHTEESIARSASTQPLINSDCTDAGGGSGGELLAYRNKQWVYVGVTIRTGYDYQGHKPYNKADGNFTQSIAFDQANLNVMNDFATRP